jgi:tRNA pseudouridine55 synthase
MNGFLVINKSSGMSSYDVIRRLKKLSRFNKIGYIGTLDRNATGILPVAVNEGVKLIPFLEDGIKAYKARFVLGITTDTLDIDGQVLTRVEPERYERAVIEETLKRFIGRITQEIPAYSSKKVNRKPLYKLARKGIPLEKHEKEIEIFEIKLLDHDHPYVDVEVICSKGTYIRALANDFGKILGCGAALHALERTRHGEFTEEMAVGVEKFNTAEDLPQYLLSLEKVVKSLREIVVERTLERFIKHGMPIPLLHSSIDWKNGELAKLLNAEGSLIGLGAVDTVTKTVKIKRLINL